MKIKRNRGFFCFVFRVKLVKKQNNHTAIKVEETLRSSRPPFYLIDKKTAYERGSDLPKVTEIKGILGIAI